jgi:hypothetical protein
VAAAAAVDPVAVEEALPAATERERSLRLVVVLEQWLDAIHVVRAEPRA